MCDNPMPDSWTNTPLSDFASNEPNSFVDGPFGSDLKVSDYTDEGVRILQLQNLGDGHFIDDNVKFTSSLKAVSLSRCLVKPGDLLIAKMADPLARACIVPIKVERALIVADLIKLRLGRQHDATFIVSAINGTAFRREAERLSTGTTRTRISLSTLKRIHLKAPPPHEQRRIGTLIRTLDDAIEQTEALIAKHQQIKAGLMHDLFTRGVTPDGHLRPTREQAPDLYKESPLGWIPKEWGIKRIQELGVVKGGKRVPAGTPFADAPTPFPYLRVTDMVDGWIDDTALEYVDSTIERLISSYKIFRDDIYVTIAGTLGQFGRIPEHLNGAQLTENAARITGINQKIVDLDYLCFVLRSDLLAEQKFAGVGVGAGVPKLALYQIERFQAPIPSLEEQRQIQLLLNCSQSNILENRDVLRKLRQQKHGLMHDLLTGRVRIND